MRKNILKHKDRKKSSCGAISENLTEFVPELRLGVNIDLIIWCII